MVVGTLASDPSKVSNGSQVKKMQLLMPSVNCLYWPGHEVIYANLLVNPDKLYGSPAVPFQTGGKVIAPLLEPPEFLQRVLDKGKVTVPHENVLAQANLSARPSGCSLSPHFHICKLSEIE